LPTQDRHAEAFYCPTPTTRQHPGNGARSPPRLSPVVKRITGMTFSAANFLIAVSCALPTSPNAFDLQTSPRAE